MISPTINSNMFFLFDLKSFKSSKDCQLFECFIRPSALSLKPKSKKNKREEKKTQLSEMTRFSSHHNTKRLIIDVQQFSLFKHFLSQFSIC